MARNIGATLSLNNGNFFTNMKSAVSATGGLKSALGGATSSLKTHGSMANTVGGNLKSLAGKVLGVVAAYATISAIKKFGSECLEAANTATEANTRLNTIMAQIPGNTDAMTASVAAYASELSKVTSIGGSAQKMGASQLASFQMSAESIKTLMPQLNNLAVAQYGVNVSSDQMISAANMLGKAYSGQTSAMTRAGIVMSEEQANLIKTGDEATKTATLVAVLQQNFGNLAEEMAKTPQGALLRLQHTIGGLKAKIGSELQPVVTSVINYAADNIPLVANVVEKAIAAISPVVSWITSTAIPNIGSAIGNLISRGQAIYTACAPALENLKNAFVTLGTTIIGAFSGEGISAVSNLATGALPVLINVLSGAVNTASALIPVISALSPVIAGVAGAVLAYKGAVAVCTVAENAMTVALGIKKAITLSSGAIMAAYTAAHWALSAGYGAATAAQWALNAAMSANPIGVVLVAIGALIAIGVALYKNWDTIKEYAGKLWSGIKNVFGGIKNTISNAWNSVKDTASNVWGAVKDTVSDKLNNIKTAYQEHGGGIKGVAAGAIEAVKGYYTAGYSFIDNLTGGRLSKVVNTAKEKLAPFANAVKEKFSTVKDALSSGFSNAINFVKSSYNEGALKPVVDKMVNAFSTVKGAIAEKFNGIKDAIGNRLSAVGEAAAGLKDKIADKFSTVKDAVVSKFADIKSGVATALEPVKNIASTVFGGMKNIVSSIVGGVKEYFSQTINNIKTTISNTVSGLAANFSGFRDKVVSAFAGIKSGVQTVFEGVKNIVGGVVKTIVGIFTLNFDTIKSGVQSVKDGFSTAFEGVRTVVMSVWSAITSVIGLAFNNIRTVAANAINAVKTQIQTIKSTVSGVFSSVLSTISNTFNSVKSTVSSVFNNVVSTIKGAIDKVKGLFNFSWELPKIKLPHFSVSPAGWQIGDLLKGSIPKLSIEWYKNGGIMTKPTLFGMRGGTAMVGGEAGAEAILPLSQFWTKLAQFVSDSRRQEVAQGGNKTENHLQVIVYSNNQKDEEMADTVAKVIIGKLENM